MIGEDRPCSALQETARLPEWEVPGRALDTAVKGREGASQASALPRRVGEIWLVPETVWASESRMWRAVGWVCRS